MSGGLAQSNIRPKTARRQTSLIPREHGAWAMLLQPFAAALIVYHRLTWQLLPALAAVVLVFLLRDPLIVLARQRWVWRGERSETVSARRYLAIELVALAACGALLMTAWPLSILAALGGIASALTLLAVYMTIRNRQALPGFRRSARRD